MKNLSTNLKCFRESFQLNLKTSQEGINYPSPLSSHAQENWGTTHFSGMPKVTKWIRSTSRTTTEHHSEVVHFRQCLCPAMHLQSKWPSPWFNHAFQTVLTFFKKLDFCPFIRWQSSLCQLPYSGLMGWHKSFSDSWEESLLSLLMLISWSYQDSVLLRPRMQTVRAGAAPWRKVPTRKMDKRHTITSTERC